MLLAFDKSEAFAFDKAGGEPCKHLDACNACSIHEQLSDRGFKGCVAFDCHGAGQRVVQEVFAGKTWRDDPALIPTMSDAFYIMRSIHDLLTLLTEAEKLSLTASRRVELDRVRSPLVPKEEWTPETLAAFDLQASRREVHAFLGGLRDVFGERPSV